MQKKLNTFNISGLKNILLITTAVVLVSGCGNSKTVLVYMPGMEDQISVKSQEGNMRLPVAGTLPQGFTRYPYAANEGLLAEKKLSNPLPRSKAVMLQGQRAFNTYCSVCHGPRGLGNGSVVPDFPRPPSLHSDKVRNWKDGYIFHVQTAGQNLMPSYTLQVSEENRWAIVHYIRALQRAEKPKSKDIDRLRKQLESLR